MAADGDQMAPEQNCLRGPQSGDFNVTEKKILTDEKD